MQINKLVINPRANIGKNIYKLSGNMSLGIKLKNIIITIKLYLII